MSQANADKQRAYRERKKRDGFLSNDFGVTKLLKAAEEMGQGNEYREMIEFIYDILAEGHGHETAVRITSNILFAIYPVVHLKAYQLEPLLKKIQEHEHGQRLTELHPPTD